MLAGESPTLRPAAASPPLFMTCINNLISPNLSMPAPYYSEILNYIFIIHSIVQLIKRRTINFRVTFYRSISDWITLLLRHR